EKIMKKAARLVLTDGAVYEGFSFGAEIDTFGEVVFNTSMMGYQEMLTDPSYAGQIVVPTYPLIGNYGINGHDDESSRIQVKGFVVREECLEPSNYQSVETIHQYLMKGKTPGICGLDTRAITRKLRSVGVMMGMITTTLSAKEALFKLSQQPVYGSIDFVKQVSTAKAFEWEKEAAPGDKYKVVVFDCGTKRNILRLLRTRGCQVTVVPCTTSAHDILKLNPDGILLSPGPGDPELLNYAVKTVHGLIGKKPIMGICLGNQLIARAFGAKTFKLKFGHRGGNHPVKEYATGRVHITAQNHGYAVDADTLKDGLEVTHINLNDNTVEGLKHKELPIFSIQYHSEDSPGPMDNRYLFDRFVKMMEEAKL
ncbi:MAG: glutamine-hydrolyzing carbamoyl-phosphate synthase small subunit, partial [Dehalococcoidales bacterium]|nr:glutamine-hydrolyzing carbamoyl-phosphate synthase small subunit [Dehalococcoidales bacterium]